MKLSKKSKDQNPVVVQNYEKVAKILNETKATGIPSKKEKKWDT